LREAIQKLPHQYRIILVLRDTESLADEEVAEITGLRAGTVRVRLHRARLFVQKLLANAARNSRSAKRPMVRPGISNPKPSVKRRASCKALFAQLSDDLDEQLDDSVCEKLEQHFDGCEPCKMFLASLAFTIEQLRRAPPESFDKEAASRLRYELPSKLPLSFAP
jgi:RNA polymerase sigma-70 factor, ECF subfamily